MLGRDIALRFELGRIELDQAATLRHHVVGLDQNGLDDAIERRGDDGGIDGRDLGLGQHGHWHRQHPGGAGCDDGRAGQRLEAEPEPPARPLDGRDGMTDGAADAGKDTPFAFVEGIGAQDDETAFLGAMRPQQRRNEPGPRHPAFQAPM